TATSEENGIRPSLFLSVPESTCFLRGPYSYQSAPIHAASAAACASSVLLSAGDHDAVVLDGSVRHPRVWSSSSAPSSAWTFSPGVWLE
ncbi:unnamed protein product, partial [Urochloa humidicola]